MKNPRVSRKTFGRSSQTPGREVSSRCKDIGPPLESKNKFGVRYISAEPSKLDSRLSRLEIRGEILVQIGRLHEEKNPDSHSIVRSRNDSRLRGPPRPSLRCSCTSGRFGASRRSGQ